MRLLSDLVGRCLWAVKNTPHHHNPKPQPPPYLVDRPDVDVVGLLVLGVDVGQRELEPLLAEPLPGAALVVGQQVLCLCFIVFYCVFVFLCVGCWDLEGVWVGCLLWVRCVWVESTERSPPSTCTHDDPLTHLQPLHQPGHRVIDVERRAGVALGVPVDRLVRGGVDFLAEALE